MQCHTYQLTPSNYLLFFYPSQYISSRSAAISVAVVDDSSRSNLSNTSLAILAFLIVNIATRGQQLYYVPVLFFRYSSSKCTSRLSSAVDFINVIQLEISRFTMSVIIHAVKSFFFSRVNSYSLRRKPNMFYFFYLFCREMIRVVCAIFIVVIKDLEMHLNNSNLPLKKSPIWFESLAQKRETSKQTTDALYY